MVFSRSDCFVKLNHGTLMPLGGCERHFFTMLTFASLVCSGSRLNPVQNQKALSNRALHFGAWGCDTGAHTVLKAGGRSTQII